MSGEDGFDPRRMPEPDVQDPEVSRDVDLGTATRADFTAPDTAPVAEADLDDLLAMLESDDAPTRRRAILALAERGADEPARERLLAVGRDDPDADARQFAIEALARMDASIDAITPGLADPDPWVRAETVVSLKKTGPEAAVDVFERALDDPHPAVRRNAVISLHHVRGAAARDTIIAALEDESDRVREWAVRLLGTIDKPEARDAIVQHLPDETSQIVRDAANRALDEDVEVDLSTGGSTRKADAHVLNRKPGP